MITFLENKENKRKIIIEKVKTIICHTCGLVRPTFFSKVLSPVDSYFANKHASIIGKLKLG